MDDTDIKKRLCSFKGLILDADGVFFTGHEHRATLPSGDIVISKTRSYQDGQGLSFLRALGIKIVFASGEGEPLEGVIKKFNELPSSLSGEWVPISLFAGELQKGGKVASVEAWLEKNNLTWDECVYIGDDRTDLEAIQKAGLKAASANARRIIKRIADVILESSGGNGAVRDFAEMVLDARQVDEATLPIA